jgi:hypothetical protein
LICQEILMNSPTSRQVGGDHYIEMAVQPWHVLRAALSCEAWYGYLRGNCIKYLLRAGRKGDAIEDLRKAQHYLETLIHEMEEFRDAVD